MNILRLAWHYLRFHKAKTAILVACIGLTIYLPVTSQWLVGEFEARPIVCHVQSWGWCINPHLHGLMVNPV